MVMNMRFPKVLVGLSDYGGDFNKDCIFTHPEAIISLGKYGALDKTKSYLEPACGIGNLSMVLRRNEYQVTSADKLEWGYGEVLAIDEHEDRSYDVVITNPPYSIWEEFLSHCFRIAKTDIFLLFPTRYLEGDRRSKLLRTSGLTEVLVFSYRLKMYNAVGDRLSGLTSYSWFHWDLTKGQGTIPTLGWLYR